MILVLTLSIFTRTQSLAFSRKQKWKIVATGFALFELYFFNMEADFYLSLNFNLLSWNIFCSGNNNASIQIQILPHLSLVKQQHSFPQSWKWYHEEKSHFIIFLARLPYLSVICCQYPAFLVSNSCSVKWATNWQEEDISMPWVKCGRCRSRITTYFHKITKFHKNKHGWTKSSLFCFVF